MQITIGDHVKNRITGHYLGRVDAMAQITVAVVAGSNFVPGDLEVTSAPRSDAKAAEPK